MRCRENQYRRRKVVQALPGKRLDHRRPRDQTGKLRVKLLERYQPVLAGATKKQQGVSLKPRMAQQEPCQFSPGISAYAGNGNAWCLRFVGCFNQ